MRSAEPRRDYLAALDDAGPIFAHAGTILVQAAVLTHPSLTLRARPWVRTAGTGQEGANHGRVLMRRAERRLLAKSNSP